MMRALLVASCLASAACSIGTKDEFELAEPKNTCSESADCGPGGQCVDGACRATSGTFDTMLFEITASTDAQQLAGVSYLKRVDGLSLQGGRQDLFLQEITTVHVELVPPASASCTYASSLNTAGNTPPLKVIFTPSDQLLGLSATSYDTTADWDNGAYAYTFSIVLPTGDYDIYVQSGLDPTVTGQCPVVSQLYRRQTITSGATPIQLSLPAPEQLMLQLYWPDFFRPSSPDQLWSADIIDPATRRVLSNTTKSWTRDTINPEMWDANLFYSPVLPTTAVTGNEVVRLRPPPNADPPQPTLYFQRDALELFTKGVAVIDQLKPLITIVEVELQVVHADDTITPAAATVALAATQLDGLAPGTFAAFETGAPADANGKLVVKLLPGTYNAVVTPAPASGLAAQTFDLTVSGNSAYQAGHTFPLLPAIVLNGEVTDPTEQRTIRGASVQALASPASIKVDPLDVGAVPFVPVATSAVTGDGGLFSFQADPGVYDLSVRPPDASGYSWFVRPNVKIGPDSPVVDLGTLALPLPVAYTGVVTAPMATADGTVTKAVPDALIRAYVYMTPDRYTSDPNSAKSVLQVAETRTLADGHFELLIPSAFK